MISKCCFCDGPVLGVDGQDGLLDTLFLNEDEPQDRLALDQEVFGHHHIKCLIESGWCDFWQSRIIANYLSVRRFRVVYSENGAVVLRLDRSGSMLVVPSPGVFIGLMDISLRQNFEGFGKDTIGLKFVGSWHLPQTPEATRFKSTLLETGELSLNSLFELYGAQATVFNRRLVEAGRIRQTPRETEKYFNRSILHVEVDSGILIPEGITECLRKLLTLPRIVH